MSVSRELLDPRSAGSLAAALRRALPQQACPDRRAYWFWKWSIPPQPNEVWRFVLDHFPGMLRAMTRLTWKRAGSGLEAGCPGTAPDRRHLRTASASDIGIAEPRPGKLGKRVMKLGGNALAGVWCGPRPRTAPLLILPRAVANVLSPPLPFQLLESPNNASLARHEHHVRLDLCVVTFFLCTSRVVQTPGFL